MQAGALEGFVNTAPHLGIKFPKNPNFRHVFQPNMPNIEVFIL